MVKMIVPISNKGKLPDKQLLGVKRFLEGRRYFGRAGAGLENQLKDPKFQQYKPNPKVVNIGISGEKKTSAILREWIDKHPEAVLVDSISLPLDKKKVGLDIEVDEEGVIETGDTDHLIIIGSSLIVIDSKNWKAKSTYSIGDDYGIKRGAKYFSGSRPKAKEMKYLWQKYYKDLGIEEVYVFVCISDPDTVIIRNKNWWRVGYKLVNQTTLVKFLDELYNEDMEENSKGFIRIDLVTKALAGLIKPYDPLKERYPTVYKALRG